MEKKYTILRVIATLYKIAGVLIALGTVLMVVITIIGGAASSSTLRQYGVDGGPLFAVIGAIFVFISGSLGALGIYAIGEALYLLIGLEENTRFTAILLRDRFYPQPQVQQPMQPPMPQPYAPPPPTSYPPVA
jgi:hypothetical protein